MFILSAATPSTFSTISSSRVPFASSSSSSKLFAVSFAQSLRNPLSCPCLVYSLKLRAMAKMVKDKESSFSSSSAAASAASESGVSPLAISSEWKESNRSRTFLNAASEEEILSGIKKEAEEGRLPSNVAAGMEELYQNYKNAIFQSGNPNADEIVFSNMTAALDRIFLDVEEPFVFAPYHKALREPFDYYMFGQNYIRPLVDFRNSYVGNISIFNEMEEKLKEGHNIILISNHQTEADPAVISLLLETTNPHIAENMIYVAGDRVVTDPLCKPFSIGRNLVCVYSKKHMFDVPELAEMKRKANTRSLKEMALLLRGGSQLIWIAPSGGRDRPDPVTEEWHPAPFDASSVDNMRRLAEHAGVPGHIYPLALLCYNIMPPPPQVEKDVGEKRLISFHGVGLSVAPEVNFSEISASCKTSEEAGQVYTQALYNSVNEQYNVLKSAVHGKQGLHASTPAVSLSQLWN
ncbi:glycerol-3-phosphate acyltransferase ATS12, chloroplastic [Ziziphus jujuba]|uniref:Glycerol-3-phosphate acyltransferase, chloroplastic n=1 Tax=Ziziphus jujuba TaxID=326968 RepID=A0A6P3ZNB1_ZIZJJ|nr:glycerol-3-phosphate acyltransferase ATS12, chloroplastic [Ziziphus jujuba]